METLTRTDSFDFGHNTAAEEPVIGPGSVDFPFLRADHSFDANTLQNDEGRDPSSICLSFNEGDVVFVHWVHDLGWGDVTLLNTGKRGWTPINYFSPCTDAKAIPLLSAAANFISQPKSYRIFKYDDGTVEHSFSQAAINEVVGGVRSLLDMSGTLSRESPVAQRSQAIRRHRKALLTELAYMVSVAKQHKKSTDDAIIDRLVRGCFRVVSKAVTLLDVWHMEAEPSTPSPAASPEAAKKEAVLRPGDLQIDEVSTTLCDYLGIFVHRLSSLGSDPTASVQILTNTRHCMLACRELLVVVEAISASSTPRNKELERLKDAMFVQTRHLVHAARKLVASLNKPHDEVKKVAEELSVVARECSRLACECAVWCHNVHKPESAAPASVASLQQLSTSASAPLQALTANAMAKNSPSSAGAAMQSPSRSPARHQHTLSREISSRESSHNSTSRPSSLESPAKTSDEDDTESIDLDAPPTLQRADSLSPGTTPGGTPVVSPRGSMRNSGQSIGHSMMSPGSPGSDSSPRASRNPQRLSSQSLETDRADLLMKNDRVVAGSLRALVSWLGESQTPEYSRHVFLVCFRLFSTPSEVAEAILENSCFQLAVKWVESYWQPEDVPALALLSKLENAFLRECINQRRLLQPHEQLVEPPVLDRSYDGSSMIDLARHRTVSSGSANSSSVSVVSTHSAAVAAAAAKGDAASRRSSINRGIGMVRRVSHEDLRIISTPWTLKFSGNNGSDIGQRFLEFDPIDVAGQLYVMDWEHFSKIEPGELLDQRFSKQKRALGLAPHVVALVTQSNHLSAFVGETVLGSNLSVKTRRNVIRMWIRIASILHDLGNFNSLVTILSTLRSSSIVRLRKVWDMISPKKMQLVTSLGKLAAPDRNFADLRSELRTRKSHCIPYVGLFLSDLTLLEEGNPKCRVQNGKSLINFDRYMRLCDVIARIQHHQRQSQPTISLNPSLKQWLKDEMTKSHSALVEDVDVQWRKSCIIEPPA